MPSLDIKIKSSGAAKRLVKLAQAHPGQIRIESKLDPSRQVDAESLINVMALALVPCVLHYDKAAQLEKWDFDFIRED